MANTETLAGDTDFGDFVKDEDEEVDLEELVEPWHRYDAKDNESPLYPSILGKCSTRGIWLSINLALAVVQLSGWHLTCKTREPSPLKSWP
jgi:hypothetical protein